MDIDWPYVRQITCNDRTMFERPNLRYIRLIRRMLPDVRILGFGRGYDGTWFLTAESKAFPFHIDNVMGNRQPVLASSLYKYLNEKAEA